MPKVTQLASDRARSQAHISSLRSLDTELIHDESMNILKFKSRTIDVTEKQRESEMIAELLNSGDGLPPASFRRVDPRDFHIHFIH